MINKEEEFDIIYKNLYDKYFTKFEKMRMDDKKDSKISLLGVGLIFLAALMVEIYLEEKNNILLYIAIILGTSGVAICAVQIRKESNYYELYKKQVIAEFVSYILPGFKYLPDVEIEEKNKMINIYEKAEFDTDPFNRSESDDYIFGNINNIEIKMCDLNTYYEEYIKNNEKRQKNRFKGLFVNAKLSNLKNIEIKILNKNRNENRTKVKLDNDEFNNNFTVVSNSAIEVYEIITADVIQILNDCLEKNKIKFDISIKNNIINFRFYTDPIFEPARNEQVMKKDSFYRYYNIFDYVINFLTTINKIYEDLNF